VLARAFDQDFEGIANAATVIGLAHVVLHAQQIVVAAFLHLFGHVILK
jgi:hypothetical protein